MKMNFWSQFLGSMAKPEYYVNLLRGTMGNAISYVVLLTFIASLSFGMKLAVAWNETINTLGMEIQTKSPDFIFQNGELTVKAPMPYVISDTKELLIIVDTSGKSNGQLLEGHEKGLLISKDKVIDKTSLVETRTYDLSKIKDITFTKADVMENLPMVKWFNILIVIGLFLFSIVANLVSDLIVAFFGWLASKMISYQIIFNDLYKISLYAITLPLFLDLAKDLLGIKLLFFDFVFYFIAITYVVRVLKWMKQRKTIVNIDEEV